MESKGTNFNSVTAQSVTAEDPWFLTFKPNSLKANITALKKEFRLQANVEAMHKLLLTILTTQVESKEDDNDNGEEKAFVVVQAPKHMATNIPMQASAKKPDLETKNVVTSVVTQAVCSDSNSREKLTVVVTMPSKVIHKSQLTVEFVSSSNGAKILCGFHKDNMDKLNKGVAGMSGLNQ
jgi:hypothetical protein